MIPRAHPGERYPRWTGMDCRESGIVDCYHETNVRENKSPSIDRVLSTTFATPKMGKQIITVYAALQITSVQADTSTST